MLRAEQMKIAGQHRGAAALRRAHFHQRLGVGDVLHRVARAVFLDQPVGGDAALDQPVFHDRGFRHDFVKPLTAAEDGDLVRIRLQLLPRGFQTARKRLARLIVINACAEHEQIIRAVRLLIRVQTV